MIAKVFRVETSTHTYVFAGYQSICNSDHAVVFIGRFDGDVVEARVRVLVNGQLQLLLVGGGVSPTYC